MSATRFTQCGIKPYRWNYFQRNIWTVPVWRAAEIIVSQIRKRRLIKKIIILIILCVSLSCNDGTILGPVEQNDIVRLAYDRTYKVPENFYWENNLEGSIYYENTVSILPLELRENIWIELSTNNRDSAFSWSEASSNNSAYYRELIGERETEKFFEFKRRYDYNHSDIILSRVHKLSYLDRSMYDYFQKGEVIGIFNKENYNKSDFIELIEYLWFKHNHEIGKKIFKTLFYENGGQYFYKLYEIHLVRGDWGIQDKIKYYEITYTLNKSTREIKETKKLIKEFSSRNN